MERYFHRHGRFSGLNLWPHIGKTELDNEFLSGWKLSFTKSTQHSVHWVVLAAGPVHGMKDAGEIL